jgi:hypothetical protein
MRIDHLLLLLILRCLFIIPSGLAFLLKVRLGHDISLIESQCLLVVLLCIEIHLRLDLKDKVS